MWNQLIPTKVSVFSWLTFWERAPMLDFPISRGMVIPNQCVMFCRAAESVNHLLLIRCLVAAMVCYSFLSRFIVRWVLPPPVKNLILEWRYGSVLHVNGRGCVIWDCIPSAVSWCLWKEATQGFSKGPRLLLKNPRYGAQLGVLLGGSFSFVQGIVFPRLGF